MLQPNQFILYDRDAISISEPSDYWPGWSTIRTIYTEPGAFEIWLKHQGMRSRKWHDHRDPPDDPRRCVTFKNDQQRMAFILRWL